ncbi:nuclear transport factor 2 family protein [Haliscomenobacter sp.]|uniref:nuclear transport factor 2 family protein n=1 Tax=Haliscomenobacter sp. TaxID=2717303 RepID=UPI00359367D1
MTSTNADKLDSAIAEAVEAFIKAGDRQDITLLESVLHPEYRSTINQFMGQENVTVIPREVYLKLVQDGKIGGSPRSYQIVHAASLGHTAQVQVHMESAQLVFNNFLSLVQDTKGKWWLINDAATAKPKS